MAAHHLDEGLLGWVYMAVAIAGGLTLTGLAGYLGARLGVHLAREGAEAIHHI